MGILCRNITVNMCGSSTSQPLNLNQPVISSPISNSNSVSIEMCSTLAKGTSASKPNHSGWTFTESVVTKTAGLVKSLMQKYNIPLDNVVRHYDASGKLCPGILGWNDGIIYSTNGSQTTQKNNSNEWQKFKSRLS